MEDFASPEYDPSVHLAQILGSPANLSELANILSYTNKYKLQLDRGIDEQIRQYNGYQKNKTFNTSSLAADLDELTTQIDDTKKRASETESTITKMTSNIKTLDEGKKNLVLSMTVLKRLQMLIIANDTLQELIPEKNYSEILNLISVVIELINHFKNFKSIDEIAQLTKQINNTQTKFIDTIFEDFETNVNQNRHNGQLAHACQILDLFGQSYRDKLINWYCNTQLREINTIFKSGDEAGGLENLNRRFLFFKRVLGNVETNHKIYFPDTWDMRKEISIRFCDYTKNDLKNALIEYKNSKNADVNVLLSSLQDTLDFEGFLNTALKTDEFDQRISASFEPYLNIWISKQDEFLRQKFLEFLSSPKLPIEILNQEMGVSANGNVPNIIPSSADLFRIYRNLLTQSAKLSSGNPLLELTKLFNRWLKEYSYKIITPLLPLESNLVGNNNESLKYLTLILNTSDYCSSTSTQLEEKIKEIILQELADKVSFDSVREIFIHLIAQSVSLLLAKIAKDMEFVWREFQNSNWNNLEEVGDVSRYVTDLQRILVDNMKVILPLITREGYIKNFCDKVVELVSSSFVANVIQIRPISVITAEQLLLDLQFLKGCLIKLPSYADPTAEEEKVSSLYTKHVNTQIGRVEKLLKLLLTQLNPMEGLVSNYFVLIGDRSLSNFNKILDLKGITDRAQKTKLHDLFNVHLTAHDDLVENSPILANLNINEPRMTLNTSTNNILSNSLISPKLNLNDSFGANLNNLGILQNNKSLNMNDIEKSFKELGEKNVNKINENFKNFGKLFRREKD